MSWNQSAEQTFGFTRPQALGKMCWKLLSGRDSFGNKYCCEACPVRTTAFNDETVNRFEIYLETNSHEHKRFTVTPLMLLNGSHSKLFVHLCHPAADAIKPTAEHSAVHKSHNPLTPRESEVLNLLNKGMTISAIAAELSVCTSTVRNHVQHILSKLDVHSRFEAVALGQKLGLI